VGNQTKKMPQGHDRGYKRFFSDPKMVADLIRGFVPHAWADTFDWDSIEPVPTQHVSDSLEERTNDRAWRLRFKQGEWVYMYWTGLTRNEHFGCSARHEASEQRSV